MITDWVNGIIVIPGYTHSARLVGDGTEVITDWMNEISSNQGMHIVLD